MWELHPKHVIHQLHDDQLKELSERKRTPPEPSAAHPPAMGPGKTAAVASKRREKTTIDPEF